MSELTPLWMARFLEQDLYEEKEEAGTPKRLLKPACRNYIWWMCKEYGMTADGIRGQTCNLLERYLAKMAKTLARISLQGSETQCLRKKEDIVTSIPILTSVCIALVTKMMSTEMCLRPIVIKDVLKRLKVKTTLAKIIETEMEVLSALGFFIPMFTNVEKALMMAVDVGMSGEFVEGARLATEVLDYFRSDIQAKVNCVAFYINEDKGVCRKDVAKTVKTMHLIAGTLLASGWFLMYDGPDPLPRLCFLTQTPTNYINSIGQIIHNKLKLECGSLEKRTSRKRKYPRDFC